MIKKEIEKKYAQALFTTIKPPESHENILDQLSKLCEYFDYEKETFQYLINPINEQSHKINTIKKLAILFNIGEFLLNFLFVLIKKNSLSLLPGINREYKLLYYDHNNIMPIEIISAIPLNNSDKQKIIESIESVIKKKVIPEYKTEPNLIGGILIKAASTIFDGSIKAYLESLRKHIIEEV